MLCCTFLQLLSLSGRSNYLSSSALVSPWQLRLPRCWGCLQSHAMCHVYSLQHCACHLVLFHVCPFQGCHYRSCHAPSRLLGTPMGTRQVQPYTTQFANCVPLPQLPSFVDGCWAGQLQCHSSFVPYLPLLHCTAPMLTRHVRQCTPPLVSHCVCPTAVLQHTTAPAPALCSVGLQSLTACF